MIVARPAVFDRRLDLDGAGLVLPALQAEALPIAAIEPAPCTQACPAGVQVKAYVSLVAQGRFAEALEVVRRRCPLPAVCGRVCDHPCESVCNRRAHDEPVAIRALKRFVADHVPVSDLPDVPKARERPEWIAVVGAGPAGLTAAWDLRLAGYRVTLFDGAGDLGGMLRAGITSYRLPRDVLDAEIDAILRTRIDVKVGVRLGVDFDIDELKARGYKAVLLATGAPIGRPLPVEAREKYPQIEDALGFLRRVNAGDRTRPGRNVVVIGGGSTAVEAARAALRLGAETVDILYRRSEEELLASAEEVEAAQAEGVRFRFLITHVEVREDGGRMDGLRCIQVGLRHHDESGRRQPVRIPGTEFEIRTDRVLAAVGQAVDVEAFNADERSVLMDAGHLAVDPETALTPLPGVFAAGDVVTGPATVIEAIAGGHRAAESIRHLVEERRAVVREQRPERRAAVEYGLPDPPPVHAARIHPRTRLPEPGRPFAEVEQAYSPEDAVGEARRCLRCGPCGECHVCVPTCRRRHVLIRTGRGTPGEATALVRSPAGVALALDVERPAVGHVYARVVTTPLAELDPSAGVVAEVVPVRAQVREERCRACGRCVEVCPFEAVRLHERADGSVAARIEPALCRGCQLCASVCPAEAAVGESLSPDWWAAATGAASTDAAQGRPGAGAYVVLACQRRAGALEALTRGAGVGVDVIRFRCVGRVGAGMLLGLVRHGAPGVLVAGCSPDRCRFGGGAERAVEEVSRARELLRLVGRPPTLIAADWSSGRAFDPLEPAVERFLDEAGAWLGRVREGAT